MSAPTKCSIRGFSLIELLAVITVIVVLVSIGAHIFSGDSSFAAALSAGTSQVSSALSEARQLAVTNNCRTRFAILTGNAANKPEWHLKSYFLLKENQGSGYTGTPTFSVVTAIESLRTGIYFQRDTRAAKTEGGDGQTPNGKTQMLDRIDTCRVQDVASAEYAYIEFLPTGAATTVVGENIFTIERGLEPGVSFPNNANYARIGVAQHTGRVRIERP